MKIDILANDGSQLGVTPKTIYGDRWQIGVGGAELAILTLAELWTKQGHDVTLYNDPRGNSDTLRQLPIVAFTPSSQRDILIIFRSPNMNAVHAKGKKVWFSTDQYAGTGTQFSQYANLVDQIVCISPFHINYFKNTYNIHNAIYIDLPVRDWDYDTMQVEKIRNRLLFSSVPHRGLSTLAACYPDIKREIPDVSLVITSDYRLWGVGSPNNQDHRMKFLRMPDVSFVGAVPRYQLIVHQLESEILAYPCVYDELFCIAVAEAQYARCLPITSNVGALETTNMGIQIPGTPLGDLYSERNFSREWERKFIEYVVEHLNNRELLEKWQSEVQERSKERFTPEVVLKQWEEKVFDV